MGNKYTTLNIHINSKNHIKKSRLIKHLTKCFTFFQAQDWEKDVNNFEINFISITTKSQILATLTTEKLNMASLK